MGGRQFMSCSDRKRADIGRRKLLNNRRAERVRFNLDEDRIK